LKRAGARRKAYCRARMRNFRKKTFFAATPVLVLAVFFSGCNTQPDHPNELNAFDGASYDSLTLAHGALTYLRGSVATSYPKYTPVFNQAVAAYGVAVNVYTLYRTNLQNQAAVASAISNLAASVAGLENALEADIHANPQTTMRLRRRALRIRIAAANASLSDILTELEIAAAVAQTVPAAQPYAALAATIIGATQQAIAAEQAVAGQAIDVSTLSPVSPIS
jgi:hypothetical protein